MGKLILMLTLVFLPMSHYLVDLTHVMGVMSLYCLEQALNYVHSTELVSCTCREEELSDSHVMGRGCSTLLSTNPTHTNNT